MSFYSPDDGMASKSLGSFYFIWLMMALLIFHSTVDGMDVNHSGASIPLGSWWLCFYSNQLLMLWLLNHRSYSFTWLLMVELLFRSVVDGMASKSLESFYPPYSAHYG